MVGVTIAESLAAQGKDVLIIFDSLTGHAKIYRQISLLLGRPAGREAYPGDIFYLHARLLERCGAFGEKAGGGSITALPIVETQSDEITDYITTNLMSITDGHILFRQNLANKGVQPPVDSGYSVSRIAGRAQIPVIRTLSDRLKQIMIQFAETERYLAFGTELQAEAQTKIEIGRRAQDICNQSYEETYLPHQQIILLYLLVSQRVLLWDRTQLIMLRIQLFSFIDKPEWKAKLQLAADASDYATAQPVLEEIINIFMSQPDTLKPVEKAVATPAEKETIIDLLRDNNGAEHAA
jgi:F-type H+-transporting ATPase subunit alpha